MRLFLITLAALRHGADLKVRSSAPEQEQDHDDDQDNCADPDATLRSPVVVSVVTTAAAEQQQDHDDQQYQVHDRAPSLFEVTSLRLETLAPLLYLTLVLEDLAQGFLWAWVDNTERPPQC